MRYSLVGVDGNAFGIMGYTSRALKETGHRDLVDEMFSKATSGDYNHLISVCLDYLDIANGEDEEDDEDEIDPRFRWLYEEMCGREDIE